jgi:hypothetical protein
MSDTKLGDPVHGPTSLVRPHFSPGLLLQDDDLTAGVTYTRALSRLLFRTAFGCGVLCGLKVTQPALNKCGDLAVVIEKGVALDCIGDPIEVPKDQTITLTCETDIPDHLWLALRRYEKCCVPRTAVCSEDAEPPTVCTRERDGFEIQIFSERPCSCGCAPLAPPDVTLSAKKSAAKKKTAAKTGGGAAHGTESTEPLPIDAECLCNHRHDEGACYHDHYQGKCPCECCESEWVLLAVANRDANGGWTVDHSVRRFVRPVLMRDPLAPA